jgi:hypothetical protein
MKKLLNFITPFMLASLLTIVGCNSAGTPAPAPVLSINTAVVMESNGYRLPTTADLDGTPTTVTYSGTGVSSSGLIPLSINDATVAVTATTASNVSATANVAVKGVSGKWVDNGNASNSITLNSDNTVTYTNGTNPYKGASWSIVSGTLQASYSINGAGDYSLVVSGAKNLNGTTYNYVLFNSVNFTYFTK